MKKLIASLQLKDPFQNNFLLKVHLVNGTELSYTLGSLLGNQRCALSNLQLVYAFPHMFTSAMKHESDLLHAVVFSLGGRNSIYKYVDDTFETTIDYPM